MPLPLSRRLFGRWRLLLVVALLVPTIGAGPSTAQESPTRPEEHQVTRLYLAVLGRQPEPGGAAFWTNQLVEGRSITSVAQFFVNSPEFDRRFGAESDEAFVALVYGNVLGRPPDAGGRAYWLDRLAAGLGRQHLVVFFSESVEYAERTGTQLPEIEEFYADLGTVSEEFLAGSWRDGCPVPPVDLRFITMPHVVFGGGTDVGVLVVHADVVADVISVFEQLYQARYPIELMTPVSDYGGDDNLSMEANNTSAFNCRPVTGGNGWSRHAYGRAVDINPRYNPYHRGSVVLPPAAASWLDRSQYHPAMIREGDVVTSAFDAVGWRWGGRWTSLVDYQHFDL